MRERSALYLSVAAIAVAAVLTGAPAQLSAQQAQPNAAVSIGDTDLGGVVSGPNGPEAGVWVIAETSDLPTKMAKIVVTDDQGRYVVPDLPKANYDVWVRGYGLVDSPKVKSAPGKILNLTSVPAPNETAAAEYYPPIYWLSLLNVPTKADFPGTGPKGNGINPNIKSQPQFLREFKTDGCFHCHAIGTKATRTIPQEFGTFSSGYEAWTRRIQSGQASKDMVETIEHYGTERGLRMLSDWTDRIAKGELPATKPPRPQGLERNVVITVWDWAGPKAYLHDEIATDKRNPTINAYGSLYGATENSTDNVPILDPIKSSATSVKIPVRDPKTPSALSTDMYAPSAYWGDEKIWTAQTIPHSLMLDEKARVWYAARIRGANNPDYCKKGSDHPSAKAFPIERNNREIAMLDPTTKEFKLIDTCFPTHHVQFGFDKDRTLWTSSGGIGAEVLGWIDTKVLEETGDEAKAQGWTPFILDTNGLGHRGGEYVEPNQPVDPTKQKRIRVGFYAVAPNPADSTIWGSFTGYPGGVVRVDPGPNPSTTALSEIYNVPLPGYSPRGADIDSKGVMWSALASGHLGAFDRSKCKGPLNGPAATGNQCPEGWTLFPLPGPQLGGVTDNGSGETPYYAWVDQHNTFGLGDDVPFATGNQNDSLIALKDGKMINLVVPYPMGFWAKALDGRIDDPNAGWKGRGVWSNTGNRTPFHLEGGKGTTPKIVHFQMRPDPLAR
ncbi:MAG TPA: carboxypeptidase-like regulatory domain-containing protein [Xanthobacteraceae bacterium]